MHGLNLNTRSKADSDLYAVQLGNYNTFQFICITLTFSAIVLKKIRVLIWSGFGSGTFLTISYDFFTKLLGLVIGIPLTERGDAEDMTKQSLSRNRLGLTRSSVLSYLSHSIED